MSGIGEKISMLRRQNGNYKKQGGKFNNYNYFYLTDYKSSKFWNITLCHRCN